MVRYSLRTKDLRGGGVVGRGHTTQFDASGAFPGRLVGSSPFLARIFPTERSALLLPKFRFSSHGLRRLGDMGGGGVRWYKHKRTYKKTHKIVLWPRVII